jgi:hypothetical protein
MVLLEGFLFNFGINFNILIIIDLIVKAISKKVAILISKNGYITNTIFFYSKVYFKILIAMELIGKAMVSNKL